MNEYDGEVWLGLGISHFSLGQKMEAGDALKNAMRFKPNQPALYYYLALNEEDDDQALRLLLRGYRIDSSNLDIIIELVNRLVRSGRKADAAAFFRKAKAIDPGNPRVKNSKKSAPRRRENPAEQALSHPGRIDPITGHQIVARNHISCPGSTHGGCPRRGRKSPKSPTIESPEETGKWGFLPRIPNCRMLLVDAVIYSSRRATREPSGTPILSAMVGHLTAIRYAVGGSPPYSVRAS